MIWLWCDGWWESKRGMVLYRRCGEGWLHARELTVYEDLPEPLLDLAENMWLINRKGDLGVNERRHQKRKHYRCVG